MAKLIVVGAGMAGLLAGAMLRTDCARIVEAQQQVPNNHSALLRFRSQVVGDVLGVQFKRVSVMKSVAPWRNSVADAMAYARKATGSYALRSSLSATGEIEERFIAPDNFIQQMVDRVQATIEFNRSYGFAAGIEPVISTIPMQHLMKALHYPRIHEAEFHYQHGANINATVSDCNAYCTLYVPNPEIEFNRVSITGNRLTIEFAGTDAAKLTWNADHQIEQALKLLGMNQYEKPQNVSVADQRYAKILPTNEAIRRHFIIWASEKFNIYALGRFATWRPGLLLDDVVNDVRVIQRLIADGHVYDHRKK